MKSLTIILGIELIKVRKSRIFPWTIVFFAFVACMMGLLMFVQKYPDISGKLGMIGTKATMLRVGEPTWQNFFNLLMQGIAGVGLVGIGFVTSWIFGREFTDHTMKDILVVPVSRTSIVVAKLTLVFFWSVLLAFCYLSAGITVGFLIGLDSFTTGSLLEFVNTYMVTSLLIIILSTPIALLASFTGGYILPLGFVILTLILANFSGLVGLGPYFPWSIPGLYGMGDTAEGMQLNIASYIIIFLTGAVGFFGTVAYWKYADHK